MAFDNSRLTFDPFQDYSAVVMEQGRVQTDADWNEYLAELSRRTRAGTLDAVGHAVYPQTTPNAFKIDVDSSSSGQTVRVGLGRMYVDGILVENHGDPSTATWDPALAELSNTPQPQPTTPQVLDDTNSILFEKQKYGFGAMPPATAGAYVAYLDVWERPVTYVEDANLIDIAIGVDTTGRLQTAWRVGFLPLPALVIPGKITAGSFSPGDPISQTGESATAVVIGPVPADGPMIIGQLTGNVSNSGVWSNSGSGQFTPSAAPTGTGSYIEGSVTSGAFNSNETVVQSGTGATATLLGTVPSAGPMMVGAVSGSPAPLAPWTGQTSGAVFTPVSAPSISSSSIAGSITSGSFIPNEVVSQSSSGASATLIGPVPAAGPMIVGVITGNPDNSGAWKGQQSNAVFTPSAVPAPSSWTCSSSDSSLPWPASSGTLTTLPTSSPKSGPCCLTAGSGYTGPENQFYRIEIHTPGGAAGAGATFKWSRENASVQTLVTAINSAANTLGDPASSLTVQSLGRDQVLGFNAGDWIEITDESHDDYCLPGEIYKIDRVDVPSSSIILTTQLTSNFSSTTLGKNTYTRIIRWDQSGEVYNIVGGKQQPYYNLDTIPSGASLPNGCGGIPIPTDGSSVVLENGIAITFGLSLDNGSYQAMDFWNLTARAADGSIETLKNAPPRGLAHHFTKLSIVTLPATGTATASDCRTPWPPSGAGEECACCCTCTVGDNQKTFGTFPTIQKAIDSLIHGGEVCLLAGDFYENVSVSGKRNIVIHGCGDQTRVWSASLNPAGGTIPPGGSTAVNVPAVFSIAKCVHIEMDSFAVIADEGEVGILMDRLPSPPNNNDFIGVDVVSNKTIAITDLEIGASTLPAIAALGVSGLEISQNRVLMTSTASLYPAVYLAGEDIRFERNQVSIQADVMRSQELLNLNQATGGLENSGNLESEQSRRVLAVGGVQVGGPSRNVWIVENQITGGSRNGITLGNIIYLDPRGNDNGTLVGVMTELENTCSQGGSGSIPGTHQSGGSTIPVAAGGAIRNLHILRNTIRETGMCGIGPVGFFDLNSTKEIVSLTNVLIAENLLVHTLSRAVLPAAVNASPYGYGAISLPDVENLIVRDNIINNYGVSPGAEVCGIYVYHGQGIELGRNQIRETRDLSASGDRTFQSWSAYGGRRAGIFIELATPPVLDSSSNSSWLKSIAGISKVNVSDEFRIQPPAYAPGIPALRIHDNVVRVAYGLALHVLGQGPFSILGNHLSTGGIVAADNEAMANFDFSNPAIGNVGTLAGALAVSIVNLGIAVEAFSLLQSFLDLYNSKNSTNAVSLSGESLDVTNGAVLFSNNTVQLMAQLNKTRGACSVVIMSLDHVLCSNNELWINAGRDTVLIDALLFGISLQANSNRFQEALNSVIYSGFTFGVMNVTTHNIATYCLIADGVKAQWTVKSPNIIYKPARCKDLVRDISSGS